MNLVKLILLSTALVFASSFTSKPNFGISFYGGKFSEAKKLARETNKSIFMAIQYSAALAKKWQ